MAVPVLIARMVPNRGIKIIPFGYEFESYLTLWFAPGYFWGFAWSGGATYLPDIPCCSFLNITNIEHH